uniref:Uncharacterized protein n=1 Tax=viral metagenome TaxID=1070528 RepID=A0A6M3M196_9ZZZZ
MEENKTGLLMDEQLSLDEWVDKTLSPIGDMIYFITSSISRFMDSLKLDRE